MPNQQITVALAVITNEEGKVFLTQRNDPGTNEQGKWQFPGGKIQFGEKPVEALVREVKEETGYDIEVLKLLPEVYENIYEPSVKHPFTRYHVLLLSYHCRIIGGEYIPNERETLQGKYFKKEEVKEEDCLRYTKEIIDLLN